MVQLKSAEKLEYGPSEFLAIACPPGSVFHTWREFSLLNYPSFMLLCSSIVERFTKENGKYEERLYIHAVKKRGKKSFESANF